MRLSHLLLYSAASVMAALCCSRVSPSGQESGATTAQDSTADTHPDTPEGLRHVLGDLLLIAKSGDQVKLHSRIVEMEIPNYENWFTRMLGQERGGVWTGQYGKSLQQGMEMRFQMLWMELANREGEISIQRIDTAKKYGPLAAPLVEYEARWKRTDASVGPATEAVGSFYFVDGRFRLNRYLYEIRMFAPVKAGVPVPAKAGVLVPAILINRVQPIYPELARKLRIQGMVVLNVFVHEDGTVTVQNVGAGHALLAPAAVDAVQQWRYQPTTLDGQPVAVETKVTVTFDLAKPPEQK